MSSTTSQLKSQMIQAGAGAGKTTRLVSTYFQYVEEFQKKHGRSPRVVISTFTKKATQELRERLFKYAVENEKIESLKLLQKPSSVHISTLHGLLVPFLSRYGDLAGLNPEIKVISHYQREMNDRRILKRIFIQQPQLMEILETYTWSELMAGLDTYVQEHLLHGNIIFDSSENLKKWEISSFQNWNSQRSKIKSELDFSQLNQSWTQFFQDYFSQADSWKDIESLFDRLPRKPQFRKDNPPFSEDLHQEFENNRSVAKEILKSPFLLEENKIRFQMVHDQFSNLAKEFFKQSMKSKLETGLISMSDLETLSLEIIRRHPETASKFSDNWDFWMLDEYQDTSPIQVELLKSFIKNNHEFVVGDPQQSIYLFRGARKEVFQDKIVHMKSNGINLEVVPVNWRSTPILLNFFNEHFCRLSTDFVAMELPKEKDKKKDINKTEYFGPSFVQALLVQEDENSELEDGDILVLLKKIKEMIHNGIHPKNIAVLSRTNSDLKRVINLAKKIKLEVECPSLSDFWKRREILDLISLVRFLFNPHDNLNSLVLLRSPWFLIPDDKLISLSAKSSYWLQIAKENGFKEIYSKLSLLLESAKNYGVSTALTQFVESSDFMWVSQSLDSTGRREANIWKFILDLRAQEKIAGVNLLEWLDEQERDESLDVSGQSGEAPPLLNPNRVSLMTIHASKGLEFDHIFILGMSDRPQKSKNEIFNFNESNQMMSLALRDEDQGWMYSPLATQTRDDFRIRESEESLRCLYVAMTRAKYTLTMIVNPKVESESWWSKFPLPKEVGTHHIKTAQYAVISEIPAVLQGFENAKKEIEAKNPFIWNPKTSPKRKSVTDLIGIENKNTKSSFQPVQALKKAQMGTEVHRLFESLTYNQKVEIPNSWKSAINYVLNLKNPPMSEVLSRGRPEWGFAYRKDQEIIQGAIDLWAELDEAIYIIDYKTGSSEYSEKALNQLKIYATALKDMKIVDNKKPQFLVALYPFEEKLEMIKIL